MLHSVRAASPTLKFQNVASSFENLPLANLICSQVSSSWLSSYIFTGGQRASALNHDSCLGIPRAKLPQTQPHTWTAAREIRRLARFALERLRGGRRTREWVKFRRIKSGFCALADPPAACLNCLPAAWRPPVAVGARGKQHRSKGELMRNVATRS